MKLRAVETRRLITYLMHPGNLSRRNGPFRAEKVLSYVDGVIEPMLDLRHTLYCPAVPSSLCGGVFASYACSARA